MLASYSYVGIVVDILRIPKITQFICEIRKFLYSILYQPILTNITTFVIPS